jgi:altronate hydrolase
VERPRELIRLDPSDTVAVCRVAISAGQRVCVDGGELTAHDAIPQGHKIALLPHAVGGEVIKYGHPIGVVTAPITAGQHVHTHNLATVRGRARSRLVQ